MRGLWSIIAQMISRRRFTGLPHDTKPMEILKQPHKFHHKLEAKMEGTSIVHCHPDITSVVELIKNKLYFATLASGRKEARNTPEIHLFNIDNELVYKNFYNDFGPLNLACLYRYCNKVNKKLRNPANKRKCIVHYTSQNQEKRTNAAYLITSYAILYLKKHPRDAYSILNEKINQSLRPFQDASMGISNYNIRLQDCLNALYKAAALGFFNFEDFDVAEYEKYEEMRYGDLNWMIPQKFLAFTGPSTEIGTDYHPPERYIDYFVKNGVIAVVRLNKKSYDASRFTRAGIDHYDMFMPDGSAPPRSILNQFLQLAETTRGPIAVHCKAGLGRTGSLIAAYLVKHYRMSAREAIAWLRICRPGSVIGHQQAWLECMENELCRAGQQYRLKHYGDGDMILRHKRGIYSIAYKLEKKNRLMNKDLVASKKRVKNAEINDDAPRNGNIGSSDKILEENGSQTVNKSTTPGIPNIFGKLRITRGRTPPKMEPRSQDIHDKLNFGHIFDYTTKYKREINKTSNSNHKTQGDRLNEIKAGRK